MSISPNYTLIRRLTATVILVQMIMAAKVWLPYREFPIAPVFYSFPVLPDFSCTAIYAILIGLLLTTLVIKDAARPILAFCLLFWSYSLFDYSRIQVYYTQFTIMLAGLGFVEYYLAKEDKPSADEMLNGIRLFFVFCYFWSGFYKLNGSFYDMVIPWFVLPITNALGLGTAPSWVGMFMAITELIGGLCLLFPQARRVGVVIVIAIHLFILTCIGPFGHFWNLITWPWNVFMATFSFLLFWNFDGKILSQWKPSIPTQYKLFILVVFGFFPILFAFGKWDSFFSFDLYSGKTKLGLIYLTEPEIDALPADLHKYVIPTPGGRRCIDLTFWSLGESNTLAYPEDRAFDKLHRSFSQKFYNKEKVGTMYVQSQYSVWKAQHPN